MECLIDAYENCFIFDVVILTESISAQVEVCELIIGTDVSIPAMLLGVQLKIICWKKLYLVGNILLQILPILHMVLECNI
jgi:hypothetical protein